MKTKANKISKGYKYYRCWKRGNYKVVNFSWESYEGLAYATWEFQKKKVGVKKPFAYYIGKIKIDEYMKLKPKKFKWKWANCLHSGYSSKLTTEDMRKAPKRFEMLKKIGEEI